MTGWELFTWINVAILAGGSLVVFAGFVRDLPDLLRGSNDSEDERKSGESGQD